MKKTGTSSLCWPGRIIALASAILLGPVNLPAESMEDRISDAMERLQSLRTEIDQERRPMIRELRTLRSELTERIRDLERLRAIRDSRDMDLSSLQEQVSQWEEQLDFSRSMLSEYADTFESSLSAAELPFYGDAFDRFQIRRDESTGLIGDFLAAGMELLTEGRERIESRLGGSVFPGEAVFRDGTVEAGTFVSIGPLEYFLNDDGTRGGLIGTSGTRARVVHQTEPLTAQLRELVAGREGFLLVDPSLGRAVAMEGARDSYLERIAKGGVWIVPILVLGLIAGMTALAKAWQIYTIRLPDLKTEEAILRQLRDGQTAKAQELAQETPLPAREIFLAGVTHSEAPRELVEEAIFEKALSIQPRLERLLPLIAVTAATAPLLGLLGTVTGMIHTFQSISVFGTGDARLLSSGISEALVTTEFGLIVAIPSLLLHALLSRKVQGLLSRLEHLSTRFLNGMKPPVAGDKAT